MKYLFMGLFFSTLGATVYGESMTLDVGKFNGVSISSDINVVFTQSPNVSAIAEGDSSRIGNLEYYVSGGILVLKYRKFFIPKIGGKITVTISAPNIDTIKMSGSGSFMALTDIKTQGNFVASLSGSGSLETHSISASNVKLTMSGSGKANILGVSANDIGIRMSGSGKINVGLISTISLIVDISGTGNLLASGNATSTKYEMSGSGNIDSSSLAASDVIVRTSGSGQINCTVNRSLDAKMSGSGNLIYTVPDNTKITSKLSSSGTANIIQK